MSEYQYYEFLAIDRPLSPGQMAELRALSTRAEITPTSFTNTYQWGNFGGDPAAMVEEYFDAHLYLTNWGTRQLMFRLPARLLSLETAQVYCWAEPAEAYLAGEHVVLDFTSDTEDDDTFDRGGEGWLGSIVPVREQLATGDFRALYLAWLAAIQTGEFGDQANEPPVPAGLGELTGALESFADFLRVDPYLIAVAAASSAKAASAAADAAELATWVAGLPVADKDQALIALLGGDGLTVGAELRQRFRLDHGQLNGVASGGGSGPRTVGELLDAAEAMRGQAG
ncbi:hypothetical protein ACN27F_12160 [Solwaraspora sp. WMMB335]|uniref:hypothetical protein n=1 Tax=Solwaraspora sp. WMMB335 TaxID=3404118 RepID=UPI003B93864D